ncbi:Opioid growth factor receptor (OGFr) conserved region [SAR116 cluster alpha proteobacterium HIMB100]|nr:Opioid growth factor receptor (OGFr) conserved region [SAR116 cluster alpha proteobacterium HIMB100]
MSLVNFLSGTGPDHKGRYLRDIWDFDDEAIEQTHDFIQWMFPLTERSMSVPGVPTLSTADIEAIRTSKVARANLERSAQWYLGFLRRNNHWIKSYDHNHLRITRAIKSLKLLVSQDIAKAFLKSIFDITGDRTDIVRQDAIGFWKSGVN